MQTKEKKSWFKQFWPWFLIILPMAAVVAGIMTLMIASDNKPEMVVDDYYKTGKAINADLSLLKKAKELGISATIEQQTDGLLITLTGLDSKTSISFSLFHSTQAKRDQVTMLTAAGDGSYFFEAEQSLDGKWTIRIEPFDKKWRLQKSVAFPNAKIVL